MHLIMLGAPGVGKGTQGSLLATHFSIPRFSTGEILRATVASRSPLGQHVESLMKEGLLVSDDIVNKIIAKKIFAVECKNGFILDGFPRTTEQALYLDTILAKSIDSAKYVINIVMDEEKLLHRLSGRFICANCGTPLKPNITSNIDNANQRCCIKCGEYNFIQREDDMPQSIMKRLDIYNAQTKPLVDYYKENSSLIVVNGAQSINKVFNDILTALLSSSVST